MRCKLSVRLTKQVAKKIIVLKSKNSSPKILIIAFYHVKSYIESHKNELYDNSYASMLSKEVNIKRNQ